jgi:LysM repeat protein
MMFTKAAAPDLRLERYDHLIVHVTATPPSRDCDDKDVDRMHRVRGFNGCGYHAIITRDGRWLDSDMGAVTRPIGNQGAHVGACGPGWNGRSFGISLVGGVDERMRPENNATAAQLVTLAQGIARFLVLHPKGAAGVSVMGHRDLIELTSCPKKKACPCFDVIDWWATRESMVAEDSEETADPSEGASPVDRPMAWTVESGDTLSKIAQVNGLGLGEILRLNPDIRNVNHISVGQVIRLS